MRYFFWLLFISVFIGTIYSQPEKTVTKAEFSFEEANTNKNPVAGKAGINSVEPAKNTNTRVNTRKPGKQQPVETEEDFSQANFRFTTTYSRAHVFASGLGLNYWRFVVDYRAWYYFSIFGKVQVPLTSIRVSTYRSNTFAAGMNCHAIAYEGLSVLLGISLGYTSVEQQELVDQATITPGAVVSLLYDFTAFHLALEYSAQLTKVSGVDLSQGIWHLGAGVRIHVSERASRVTGVE